MMIRTASLPDTEMPTVVTWPSVEPDRYLDARRPAWVAHERAGRVRCVRLPGERRARLYADPAATEIVEVVLVAWLAAQRALYSPGTGALRAEGPPG